MSQIKIQYRPWILAAVFVEVIAISPGPWPLPMVQASAHPASLHIAKQSNGGAVIDLPFQRTGTEQAWFYGDIFLQQVTHQRPIPFQLEGHGMETASTPIADNRFFRNVSSGLIFGQPIGENCAGLDDLSTLGVSWIVWHPQKAPANIRVDVDRALLSCLGEPKVFGDRKVFTLNPSP